MLRGTLILIAFVALTFGEATYPCTCREGGDSISDSANSRWNINVFSTVKPAEFDITAGTEIQTFVDSLSDVTKLTTQLGADLTTASLTAKLEADNALLADITQKVDNYTDWNSKLDLQIGNFQKVVTNWGIDLTERIENNDDPQIAAKVVKESFEIASQGRRSERVKGFIEAAVEYWTNIKSLLEARIDICNSLKAITTKIDEQVTICSCDRTLAATTVIATNPLTDVITKIVTLKTSSTAFLAQIQTFMQENGKYFLEHTDEDTADNVQLGVLYDNWSVWQGSCFTFEQFKVYVAGFVASTANKEALVARIGLFLSPVYTVTGGAITFTGQDDDSDVVVCKYTGTISGSLDLSAGVARLASYIKQIIYAFLGGIYCKVEHTVDTSGVFTVTFNFTKSDCQVISNTLLNNEEIKAVQVKIDEYQASAQTALEGYQAKATDDATAVLSAINELKAEATAAVEAAATEGANAQVLIEARSGDRDTYVLAVKTREAEIVTTDDKYQVIIDGFSAYKTEATADIKAFVAEYKKKTEQCTCEVSHKVIDYLQAKYDAEIEIAGGTGTTTCQEYWAGAKASLEADIKQACILQNQTASIHAEAEAQITDWETNGEAQTTELSALAEKLRTNAEETIEEVQTRLHADPAKWKERLTSMICGCRGTIDPASVVITFQNTDKALGDYIVATFQFVDSNTEQTAAEIQEQHILTVSTAIEVGGCNKGWKVAAAGSVTKRQTGGTNTYEATLGEAPTPGQPASANTLVYSFVLAIVTSFMLVWF